MWLLMSVPQRTPRVTVCIMIKPTASDEHYRQQQVGFLIVGVSQWRVPVASDDGYFKLNKIIQVLF